jgi:ParB-like chromosome segregation protein Spo0J
VSEPSESFADLVESIRRDGLLTPLCCVDQGDGTYSVIQGHRRVRAMYELVDEKAPDWTMDTMVPADVIPLSEV